MSSKMPDYAPLNPFKPIVSYVSGRPMFWDSCSVLYNMVGGSHFTDEQLGYYDHINSSSFVDIMSANMENGMSFKAYHEAISKDPSILKGANAVAKLYYQRMADKAKQLS